MESAFELREGEPLGHAGWRILHATGDLMAEACPHCQAAPELLRYAHDVKNVELGKAVFDVPNFAKYTAIALKGLPKDATPSGNPSDFRHVRHFAPRKCDSASFRTIPKPGSADRLVICCPKGHFLAGRCQVGTQVQAELTAK